MCMKSFIYDNYMSVCCLIVLYFAFTLFRNNMKNFLTFVSILIFACTFSLLVETDSVLDSALEKKYKKNELNKIYKKEKLDSMYKQIKDNSITTEPVVSYQTSDSSIDITQDPVWQKQREIDEQKRIAKLKSYRDVPVDRPYLDHSFSDDAEQKNLLTRLC
jgi:hypothetical protein